jgi:hypothetical protein
MNVLAPALLYTVGMILSFIAITFVANSNSNYAFTLLLTSETLWAIIFTAFVGILTAYSLLLLKRKIKRSTILFLSWTTIPLFLFTIIFEINFKIVSGDIYGLQSYRKAYLVVAITSFFWSCLSYLYYRRKEIK